MSTQLQRGNGTGARDFPWPAPPHFEFAPDTDHGGWADCLLAFRDGNYATGQLRSFAADAMRLTFQPDGADTAVNVPFSALLKLQLLQPVRMQRRTLPANATEPEEIRRAERYSFRIELVNGERYLGVTLGYISALCGLFLYFPEENDDVVRCFVPAQAAKTCSIDAPIGQVLIDQKAVAPEAVKAALNLQALLRSQNLGEYLTENNFVSPEQLAQALELKRTHPKQRLGEAIVELGILSGQELDLALGSKALESTMPIGQILLRKMGIVDEHSITGAMAVRDALSPL